MDSVIVPITVFVLVYIVLTFELVNKAVVAFAGIVVLVIVVLVIVGIVSGHEAVQMIDFETIMLLLGMMIIVGILRRPNCCDFLSQESFIKLAEQKKFTPRRELSRQSIRGSRHPKDILPVAKHFLMEFNKKFGKAFSLK